MANKRQRKMHPAGWISTLYAAESLPYNAVVLVSIMMYKSLGLSDSQIAFWTGALLLPWSLKPFFSPFLEMFATKRLFVLVSQLVAGAAFASMAFALPLPFAAQVTIGIFGLLAFTSAVHDTAADGVYIDALDTEGQAAYVGFQSFFWNLGQVVAQGGLMALAGHLEREMGVIPAWAVVWLLFAAIMLVLAIYHWRFLPGGSKRVAVGQDHAAVRSVASQFRDVSAEFFLKQNIWWLIAFALIYRSAEGQIEKIASLFMRATVAEGGLGMTTDDVGLIYGAAGTTGMIFGSLVGGYWASKKGLRKTLLPLALVFNIPNALFTFLAYTQTSNFYVIAACATAEKFALGMGFVGMTLVLMQQIAPGRYSTAHYGYATALMNLGMMLPAMSAGFVSDALGYQNFFVYILFAGIPSIVIAKLVPIRETVTDVEVAPGESGEITKLSAWATAKAAGSFYLFASLSTIFLADSVNLISVVAYSAIAIGGVLTGISALKSVAKANSRMELLGQPIANQNRLASAIAIFAMITWVVSAGYLVQKYAGIVDARSQCTQAEDAVACKTICTNDADLHGCQVTLAVAQAALAKAPETESLRADVFNALKESKGIECLTHERAEACLELGDLSYEPGALKTREIEKNLEDARRYYNSACMYGSKAGCAKSESVGVEMQASRD